jgi:hypothetical protein
MWPLFHCCFVRDQQGHQGDESALLQHLSDQLIPVLEQASKQRLALRVMCLLAAVPCRAAARYLMWVLEDIGEMNAMGVERMIRSLALLQVGHCNVNTIKI